MSTVSDVGPSLTIGAVCVDTVIILALDFVLKMPVIVLIWNFAIAPVFKVRRLRYVEGAVLVALMWFLTWG